MSTEQKYIEDLSEIRKVMDKSTRFLSLTGWSGILAGIYALIGAFIAYRIIYYSYDEIIYETISKQVISANVVKLVAVALTVLILAIGTAIFLSYRKAYKRSEKLWTSAAKRVVVNLSIPLITGGIFVLIMYSQNVIFLLAPATLIFYGLGLVNASKYTFHEVKQLGIIEICLGLISAYFTGFGLLFWALGFGVMHIIYGIYMHLKYEG